MPRPIPFDEYYDLASIESLAVSPDGARVAFVTEEFDRDEDESRRSLFVVPADGAGSPHRLTRVANATSPTFSPDGSKLGFLAAREQDVAIAVDGSPDGDQTDETGDRTVDGEVDDESPDEGDGEADDDPDTQVWAFDLDRGGDARQLTTLEEGASEFDWAPDGERIVVAARDPTDEERAYLDRRKEGGPIETERLQHKHDGAGWLDTVRTYLFVVDAESREATRLDDAHDGGGLVTPRGGLQPRWSPDGDRIVFRSYRGERPDDGYAVDLYAVSPGGGDAERLTDGSLWTGAPRWSPTGDRLAFAGSDPDNQYAPTELYVLDGGRIRPVTVDLDRTLARAGTPQWLDEEALLTAVGDEGRTRLVRAAVDGSGVERTFEAQGSDRAIRGLDHADGTVAVLLSHPSEGTDVHAVDVDDLDAAEPDVRRLTAVNDDELARWPTPRCERVTYESDDGTGIEAIVYAPEELDADDPEPRPLVCAIHGGPMSYDEPRFSFADACWTSRGYVVVKPNYRGSTSYGRDFCETLQGRWNSIEVQDVLAGVDALVQRGWADPDRLFCTGFSQGGVLTAYAVTKTDRFAAAAPEHGIYDARSCFGTDDCHVWWENDYGLPWENPEGYAAASSIEDVDEIETPLLVTAGGEDWRCPPSQAEQLYVSVKKRGVPAKLVVYPDEHHDVGDPDRAIHRFEELASWFGRFDPATGDESEN
ncbi:S9 family peptidase [Halovivax sp.]|uniref:S9 family peptidase n=1 Tax=Halovivax sp. TaxID=1935978 RepID=UPI0025BD777B|nr:S9 family peptidase [Halovivax sp.]